MKNRYKLTIAYEGTPYVGWQFQKNGLSIQQVLEETFHKIVGQKIRPAGAGRTDSGVHAVGQVAHAELAWDHSAEDLQKALNSFLPEEIRIVALETVPNTFHAQRDAQQKWYRYVVHQGKIPLIFERDRAWSLYHPLNLTAMKKGAQALEGRHDFASFQGAGSSVKTTVRRLNKIDIFKEEYTGWPYMGRVLSQRRPSVRGYPARGQPAERHRRATRSQSQTYFIFDFLGEGFLRQMVRNLVGSLVEVGQGKMSVSDLKKVLAAKDRKKAGCCAPPQGLYLMKVYYE